MCVYRDLNHTHDIGISHVMIPHVTFNLSTINVLVMMILGNIQNSGGKRRGGGGTGPSLGGC